MRERAQTVSRALENALLHLGLGGHFQWSRGCDVLRNRGRVAGLLAGEAHHVRHKGVVPPVALAVLLLHADGKPGIFVGGGFHAAALARGSTGAYPRRLRSIYAVSYRWRRKLQMNTRKLSKSYGYVPSPIVVQSQFCFFSSPSSTVPREKYETMRRPSAYCATSSGIAIMSRRVKAHPDSPLLVLIRLQSSVGMDFCAGAADSSLPSRSSLRLSSPRSVLESSTQLAGGPGGLGSGIVGYLVSLGAFFSSVLGFLGGGGIKGLRARSTRGVLVCIRTSTFSFSFTCKKLGDCRDGCVCTLSSPKLVAWPCTVMFRARAARSRSFCMSSAASSCRSSVQPSAPDEVRTRRNRRRC